jgi:hypothetical protein
MIILGVFAVSMTVCLTPDQMTSMLSVNPKRSLTIMPWLPAPPHFRILGAVLLMLGIALVSVAAIWSRNIKSRTAA